MKNLKIAAASIAVCTSMLLTACGAAETVDFVHSTADANGKYTCELFGVGADFNSDWTFITDEEIAKANSADSASNDDLKAVLNETAMLQDMMVTMESGTNINLVIEDTNQTTARGMNESAYIDAATDQLEAQLAAVMDNITSKKVTVTFAGESHAALDISGEAYGTTLYERMIPVKSGKYMGLFTITALSEEEINEITAMFYAVTD